MPDEDAIVAKISRRLLPILVLGYIIAFIDRGNISFAKLQMVGDLHISETAYGLGSSLFFIGYLCCELPGNAILLRVGARRWFARIMVTWGLVTILTGFIHQAWMFYVLRFLLGAAEAGFFPGILYFLTLWFPQKYRGRSVSYFVLGSVLSNIIAAPLAGVLLDMNGVLGLRGWQWMFAVMGLPAVVVGVLLLRLLPDRLEDATFLDDAEKTVLRQTLAGEATSMGSVPHGSPFRRLLDRRVAVMAVFFIMFNLAGYGFSYWLPTIVKGFGVSYTVNGLLNMVVWILVAVVLWWVPRRLGRGDDPVRIILWPSLLGGVCFVLTYYVPGDALKFAALCVGACCVVVGQPCFWALPSRFLSGPEAALAIAAINSIGVLGGFFGQLLVPAIRDASRSNVAPMLFLAAVMICRGLYTMLAVRVLPRTSRLSAATPPVPALRLVRRGK
jgi:MFS family permease